MIFGAEMKLLLVFLLLGCSVAQSTILSKCQVWDQLLKVLDPRDRVKLNLASLVCQAEQTSGFNTKAVTVVSCVKPQGPIRNRRSDNGWSPSKRWLGGPMKTPRTTTPTTTTPTTTTPTTTTPTTTTPTTTTPIRGCGDRSPNQVKTLYGIFQLSNREACSDGTTPSRNLCRLSCSKLLNADIGDDVRCLVTLLSSGRQVVKQCRSVPTVGHWAGCLSHLVPGPENNVNN